MVPKLQRRRMWSRLLEENKSVAKQEGEAEQGVGEARAGWGGLRNRHIWGSS